MKQVSFDHMAEEVKKGEIAILPTDTIYGIVASVRQPAAIERIYKLADRPTDKPCIVLISSEQDLKDFGVADEALEKVKVYWPGPVSIVLSVGDGWEHIDRGTKTIAFRLPGSEKVREFVAKSGPVVATSANPSGKQPATTLKEAQKYFPDIKLCCDWGELKSPPSTLIDLTDHSSPKVLRHGAHDHGQTKEA